MNVLKLALVVSLGALVSSSVLAQQSSPAPQPQRVVAPTPAPAQAPRAVTPAPTPAPAAAKAAVDTRVTPARRGQPVNIKVEFTLTDQRGTGAPAKRIVNAIVADGAVGQIRSSSDVTGIGGGVTLNIDTNPELLPDGKIRLGFSLQYDWPPPLEPVPERIPRGTVLKTVMHDTVSLILESGKPMVAVQSADPVVDRQVTVEVKATVLK